MILKIAAYGLAVLIVAGGIGYPLLGLRHSVISATTQVQALQTQAAEAKGKEDAAKAEAESASAQSQAWADRALDAGKRIEDLKAKLESIKPSGPSTTQSLPPVAPVVDGPDTEVVLLRELTQAQDVKITALEGQVSAQKTEIVGLRKALKLADLRADIQAQASKAALEGIKKSRWLGRCEGFAVGAAVGYAGGRFR